MKTVREVMSCHVVTVAPSALAKTAIIIMKGHEIGALPVVHNHEAVVGMVYYQELLGLDPNQEKPVSEVMTKNFISVGPETTVLEAAEIMTRERQSHLLVVEEGELIGIVSHGDLLRELHTSFDPLTGLPWSDALRDWAITELKRGNEIAIIFLDLNNFKEFNTKHGHVVGDSVLKAVADALREVSDPDKDFLSRYGGDEFCIASIRPADDAMALGDLMLERIAAISLPDIPGNVTGTFGMAGGRRTKERLDVHYAATLNDLINRASQNCTLNKPGQVEAQVGEAAAEKPEAPAKATTLEGARLKIERINFSSSGTDVTVEVELSRGGRSFVRSASGYAVGTRSVVRVVAEAAAAAVTASLASGYGVVVDDVFVQSTGPDSDVVTVIALFLTPDASEALAGSSVIRRSDIYRATVAALLAAVNRRIQTAPESEAETPGENTI